MPVDAPRFPLLGEPLEVELVNTVFARRGVLVDGLSTPDDLVAWLDAHAAELSRGVDATTAARRLEEVRALRDAQRELFGAVVDARRPAEAAVATLNRLSRRAPCSLALDWPPTGPPSVTVARNGDPGAAAVATLADAGIRLLGGPDRELLRTC